MLFSIVIPTYNRPLSLARCLTSLQALHFDSTQIEVLVVDDGGHCELTSVVEKNAGPLRVQLLRQANAGPGAARNRAAREASGSYLVFIDDDCLATPDWLHDYAQGIQRDPEAIWGGQVLTGSEQNIYCHAAQAVTDMVQEFFNADEGEARFFCSNNFAVPTARFLEMGGFMEDYFRLSSEDREFCDRWSHAGRRLRPLAGAAIYHEPSLNLASYTQMYFRYGRGAYRYQRIRKLRGSGTFQQDASFHMSLPGLLGKAATRVPWYNRLSLLGLVAVWQLANAAGFLSELVMHKLQPPNNPSHDATRVVNHQVTHRA